MKTLENVAQIYDRLLRTMNKTVRFTEADVEHLMSLAKVVQLKKKL